MIEYEIVNDERTGRTRRRQFTDEYRKAARSGVWRRWTSARSGRCRLWSRGDNGSEDQDRMD